MAKKVMARIRLVVPAGDAMKSKNLAAALGQKAVALKKFTDEFNAKTKGMSGNLPTKVLIFSDKSFEINIKESPSISTLIREHFNLVGKPCSSNPGKEFIKKIKMEDLRSIAKIKMKDIQALTEEAAMRSVAGSARSMGISVEE